MDQTTTRRASDYPAGSRWRIVKPGARITGMEPHGVGAFVGFCSEMEVGTVLTSRGISMTFGDGVPALKWANADGKHICNDAILEPTVGGMWGGMAPDPSFVEPVDGPAAATVLP